MNHRPDNWDVTRARIRATAAEVSALERVAAHARLVVQVAPVVPEVMRLIDALDELAAAVRTREGCR